MEYNVKHDEKRHRFEYDRNGLMAFVEYDLEDGVMDIFHTLVPIPMEGMGVGSALMKYALDYARGRDCECLRYIISVLAGGIGGLCRQYGDGDRRRGFDTTMV